MKLANLKNIFKKSFIIGLDIGEASVKLAQFERKEEGLYLIRADLKEIKNTNNEAKREEEIVGIIKDLFGGINRNSMQVIASINSPNTAINKVTVPYMPKQELLDSIKLGVKNYFPFPVNNSLSDSEILEDIVEKGVKKYKAIVAVSPKTTVDKYLLLLAKAGVNPTALIPVSFALQKLAGSLYAEGDKTLCFVDIGALHTELIIIKGKKLIFSRKIPVTGREITKALTGALVSDRGRIELTFDEAEKIKQEIGIPLEAETRIINDKISTAQILSMLRTPLAQLVSEIERCLDYCREESGGDQVTCLTLSGLGASLSGLTKFLSGELGIEVKLGDFLQGFKISPQAIGDEKSRISLGLAVAIGAVLSGAEGINLLPFEVKEKTKRLFKRTTLEAIAITIIFILAFIYIGLRINLNNCQKRIAVANLELTSLGPQLKQARVFSLLTDEPHWDDVFREFSNLVPNDFYITHFYMNAHGAKNKIITIDGIVPVDQGQERISKFILTLQKGIFNDVTLVSFKEKNDKPVKEFELKCWVD